MRKKIDLTGQRFGSLTVIQKDESRNYKSGCTAWLCICDCGEQKIARSDKLRNGKTKSCGCLVAELFHPSKTRLFHPSKTRLYYVWNGMKARCNSVNNPNYPNYGARGITVCDEWKNNFQAFYEWAIVNGYDENAPRGQCTIDRIDNDKGYSPDNCRWVDMNVQNRNRRPIANQQYHMEYELVRSIRRSKDPMKMVQIANDAIREAVMEDGDF